MSFLTSAGAVYTGLKIAAQSNDSPSIPQVSRRETKVIQKEKSHALTWGDHAQAIGKYVLALGAFTAADVTLTPKLATFATEKMGFCVGNYISKGGIKFLANFASPIARANNAIGRLLFGNSLAGTVLIPATCEEIEFRWFVQEILLRKLPKAVLEKFKPHLAHLVDSMPVRISRIAATGTFFLLLHAYALGCLEGGGIYQLVGGFLYSGLYEWTDYSLSTNINAHVLYNCYFHLFGDSN